MLRSFVLISSIVVTLPTVAQDSTTSEQALTALQRGINYFRSEVSIHGGYLWRYAADFSEREGEVPASATTAWVQPPGTPTIGMAYLTAYELTGESFCLEAAQESAHALVQGQLESGCWDYRIEFKESDRKKYAYRTNAKNKVDGKSSSSKGRNISTLDDNTTQAALSFLMRIDKALNFKDAAIHNAAQFALQTLLDVQYPNGAWPQRFDSPPNPEEYPVLPASYPPEWSRKYPAEKYLNFYTFNDNAIADTVELMFLAAEIYQNKKYSDAAKRAGDFILLAQMPEPQPGWAQQYNTAMQPAWARKFEPPSITGGESQGVMRTLIRIYQLTGEEKYLEPLPRALAYFRRSVLDNGQLARFYELHTNRPLYFTKDYYLTFSDSDLPTHYSFKSTSRLDAIEKEYHQALANRSPNFKPRRVLKDIHRPKMSDQLAASTAKIIATQAPNGAWVEPAYGRKRSNIPAGTPTIECRTFANNITTLARYIAALSAK